MSGTNTEDSILNSIPDFAEDTDVSTGADTGAQSDTSTSRGTPANQTGTGGQSGGTTSAQPTNTGGSGGNQGDRTGDGAARTGAQTGDGVPRRHDGLVEVPSADGRNTRDLVDPTTGQVVARGGIERHVYEVGQRHARENTALKQQVQQFQRQSQTASQTTRVANDLNLAPEHQVVAMRVMSDFMRDPVKTLEYLVAEVKSKGYTIPFLTEGVNPGMDLTAVQRLIETKMQPFTNAQQQQQQQEEARGRAQATLDGFLGQHPEANYHLPILTEMLQSSPDMTLHDAYLNLVTWAARNDLDHTQPLAPQIAARQGQQPQHTQNGQHQQQPQHQQQQPQTRQIPNGRSAANGTASLTNAANFNENSSWSDIIRSAMEEAGSSV